MGHLMRADAMAQFHSWRRARATGRFDFTERVTHPPLDAGSLDDPATLAAMLDQLAGDDAGFRRLFVCAGVRPIFGETLEALSDPRPIVARTAAALGVSVDAPALERAVSAGARYPAAADDDGERELAARLAPLVFTR